MACSAAIRRYFASQWVREGRNPVDTWIGRTMDHSQFKANQTAAVYVADGLDASTLEAFEMHMMACPECVEDVETWRAIKINMPSRVRPLSRTAVLGRKVRQPATWRMAASFLAVAIVGAAAGWFGRDGQSSSAGADS